MLDINFIRQNPQICKKACEDKLMYADIDRILELDTTIRKLTNESDNLRAERNALTKQINADNKEQISAKVRSVKEKLAEIEADLPKLREEFENLMLCVPSIPEPEVPLGKGEEDNVEIRRWGDIPVFDFEPKSHIELIESLDLADMPRAAKFAGSRSYILKNEGILLELAVTRFVIDLLTSRGFTPMGVPVMVRENAMKGTGYFPIGRDQAYSIPEDDLFLVGTSEVSLVSYHQNEVLSEGELPKRYAGISTCFRREAGAAGRDTKGLYRVHQFQKVEQVVICENDAEKVRELHYEILKNTEDVLKALELPHRVALACTGEIGIGQTRKHEVETWMPSREAYCETHSCSTLNEFQARRSNIRYRNAAGEMKFCCTLNNTGIASPRILIPLLEVHQQADGSVRIPKALVPYMGGREFIGKK